MASSRKADSAVADTPAALPSALLAAASSVVAPFSAVALSG